MARRGIALLEVVIAVVTLTIGFSAALRIWLVLIDSAAAGRRWTAMAAAAATELERLDRAYRAGAPACAAPGSGNRFTTDGVGLSWSTADLGGRLAVEVEARAAVARRVLIDTLTTIVPCR